MTPRELIPLLDSGMVEELTMYYYGHRTVFKILDLPNEYQKLSAFNCPIAKMWNSESGKGISVLLADNVVNSNELHINLSEEGADRIKEILRRKGMNNDK